MTDDYKDCLRDHGLKSTKARNGVLAILSPVSYTHLTLPTN